MAIYSCSISNVCRAGGSSSCATLSYITASRVTDERTGQIYYGYGHGDRVKETGIELPKSAPDAYKDAKVCFSSLELYEKHADARTAKKVMVALPREVSDAERTELVKEFAKQFTDHGYPVAWAIHEDKEGINPHAHLLVANRSLDSKGQWVACKAKKEYVLDDNGQRVPIIDQTTGLQKVDSRNRKQWKRKTVQSNWLDEKSSLQSIRDSCADICNKRLDEEHQISAKSLKDQGSQLVPTIHEGWQARAMEAKGIQSDRCEINRQIKEKNKAIQQLLDSIKELMKKAESYIKQKRGEQSERIRRLLEGSKTDGTASGLTGKPEEEDRRPSDAAFEERIADREARLRKSESDAEAYADAKRREELRRAEEERARVESERRLREEQDRRLREERERAAKEEKHSGFSRGMRM